MVIGDSLGGRWPVCGLCPWPWHKRVLRWAEGICSAWLLDSQIHCIHYLPKACSHLAPRLSRAALSKRRCLPSGLGSQQRVLLHLSGARGECPRIHTCRRKGRLVFKGVCSLDEQTRPRLVTTSEDKENSVSVWASASSGYKYRSN